MRADNEIEALEMEIRDLRVRIGHCAHQLADVGDRLLRAKELVPTGEWIAWLEERVQFSRFTARHYMILAALRRDDPARFEEVIAQGLKAAYVLNRSTSATCPAPERVAGQIERLAERATCIAGAPAEAQMRALEAVERLRAVVLGWSRAKSA